MVFTLGFSPCPNDTFIFDALVNNKIDTEGLKFEAVLEDVETLNQWVLAGKLDITKLSFPAYFQAFENYVLLNSGSALGKGVGPLLISGTDQAISKIEDYEIALPGLNTTANLLFSFACPDAQHKTFMRFEKIEDYVLSASSIKAPLGCREALGVIIHENRFTYRQKGLHKVMDLGEYWEMKMKVPVPLGGIAIKRTIDNLISRKIDKLIRKSLEYAFAHYPQIPDYVKQHSQTLSEDVMRQHIELYVNDYSIDLGNEGKKAVSTLYNEYQQMHSSARAGNSAGGLFLL